MKSRKEAILSQSSLLRAIYGQSEGLAFDSQGLAVYQRSLAANAKRSLAISFPTVQHLVGADCFTLLVSDFLYDHPLTGGDWGEWGGEFPTWIENNSKFDEYSYLSDCVQLDWLCHQCERAEDTSMDTDSMVLLSQRDPYQIKLRFCGGAAILPSPHPIVDIWKAHHLANHEGFSAADLFAKAAQSIAQQKPQAALVWRPEWKAQVQMVTAPEYLWLRHTLQGRSLGNALDDVKNTDFSFETWLPQAMQTGLLCGIDPLTNSSI